MMWRRRHLQSNFDLDVTTPASLTSAIEVSVDDVEFVRPALERRPGAREWNWLLLVPLAGREAHEEGPR
jgi:hypothetical protein